MAFTFVNTVGAPGLTKGAAKRVRGHVTRTNFAARREQKAQAGEGQNHKSVKRSSVRPQSSSDPAKMVQQPLSELEVAVALSVAMCQTDPERAAVLRSYIPLKNSTSSIRSAGG